MPGCIATRRRESPLAAGDERWWGRRGKCARSGRALRVEEKRRGRMQQTGTRGAFVGVSVASTETHQSGKDPEEATEEEIALCQEVEYYVERLYARREMGMTELRLVLGIEDPRAERRRTEMEVEQPTGVSRDEIVLALEDVSSGRVPRDRASLEQLADELRNWPYLDTEFEEEQASLDASYENITETGLDNPQRPAKRFRDSKTGDPRPPIGREGDEANQGVLAKLRDTFGYAYLYIISAIPVIIVAAVVTVLFRASLQ